MQEQMLARVDDAGLSVFAVWEPILRTDNERAARKATLLFPDRRVRHFWAPSKAVGRLFQAPIDLEGEPAWDVYLLYDRHVVWEEQPPRPGCFMHQLGRLPEELQLDADTLAARVLERLRD